MIPTTLAFFQIAELK